MKFSDLVENVQDSREAELSRKDYFDLTRRGEELGETGNWSAALGMSEAA
jgi:hypothetical protein